MDDGVAFCQKCGAKADEILKQEPAEQPVPEEEPAEQVATVQEQEETQQETLAEPVFAAPVFDAPEQKPKKKSKKRKWIIAAIIAGVLAVAIAACIIFWPWARGLVINTFGSSDDYLKFVEDQATQENTDKVVKAYGKYLDRLENPAAYGNGEVTVQADVNDTLAVLLKESYGTQDLIWLNDVTLKLDLNSADSAEKILVSALLNNTEIANADYIIDFDKGIQYLAFLSLDDRYAQQDLALWGEVLAVLSDPEMKDVLPTEETVGQLVKKYSQVINDSLKNAEKTTETVEIDGVQQKLTVLKIKLDFEEIKQLLKTLLETVESDEEIKTIIVNLAKHLESKKLPVDADSVYEDFLEAIGDAKESVSEMTEKDSFEKFWLSLYVDDSHKVVGKKYKFDSDAVFYITVRNGEKFASKLDAADYLIVGSGTEKDKVKTGAFTVQVMGKELGKVALQDFSTKDDLLNGTVTVTPADWLLEEALDLGTTESTVLSMLDPSLKLVFESKTDSAKVDISLVSGQETLASVTITAKRKESGSVTMPDSAKVVVGDGINQWFESLDLSKIADNLRKAGVPENFLGFFG